MDQITRTTIKLKYFSLNSCRIKTITMENAADRWHWTTFVKHKVKKKLSTDPSKTLQFILNESSSKLEKQNALEKVPKVTKAKMIEITKKENPAHREKDHQFLNIVPDRKPDQFVIFIKGFTKNNLKKIYSGFINEEQTEQVKKVDADRQQAEAKANSRVIKPNSLVMDNKNNSQNVVNPQESIYLQTKQVMKAGDVSSPVTPLLPSDEEFTALENTVYRRLMKFSKLEKIVRILAVHDYIRKSINSASLA